MADYHSPTVVVPTIPTTDMTAIEQLLLTHVFQFEADGGGLYVFAEQCMNDMPVVDIDDVREALAEEPRADCRTAGFVRDQLTKLKDDDAYLQLDAEIPWELALQDIVWRSATVEHVEVITSFTCSRMRPDGFGGAVTVITADQPLSSSTEEMAGELLDRAEYGDLACEPRFGSHVMLRLDEKDVREMVDYVFATQPPPGIDPADVTDIDVRAACERAVAQADFACRASSAVRRQNIWRRSRRKLAESGPRLGVDVKRRACGVASADARWSFA